MATNTAVERYRDKRTADWRRRTTYTIWYGMIKRCYDENHVGYLEYGARGICVHEEWLYSPLSSTPRTKPEAFRNFIRDVGLRPSQYVSLDRIKANEDYGPSNVRWATGKTQARNKRASLYVPDPDNPEVLIPVAELAERLKLTYQQLRYRLKSEGKWPGDVNA